MQGLSPIMPRCESRHPHNALIGRRPETPTLPWPTLVTAAKGQATAEARCSEYAGVSRNIERWTTVTRMALYHDSTAFLLSTVLRDLPLVSLRARIAERMTLSTEAFRGMRNRKVALRPLRLLRAVYAAVKRTQRSPSDLYSPRSEKRALAVSAKTTSSLGSIPGLKCSNGKPSD